jgi:hypothetical protein
MVMPHGQTAGDRLGKPAEVLPHALADRLQGLETSGLCMGVDADAFGGAMITSLTGAGVGALGWSGVTVTGSSCSLVGSVASVR